MLSRSVAQRALALFLIAISLLLVAGCGDSPQAPVSTPTATVQVGKIITTAKGHYTDITAGELHAMMQQKDFFLVDVHVPNEGKLPQLDARIPYDQITKQLDKLPADKSARIVLTCKSGGMSTTAARQLADLGYTHVYNLAGGFNAWKAKGYELTKEP